MGMFRDLVSMIFGIDEDTKIDNTVARPFKNGTAHVPCLQDKTIEEMEKVVQPADIYKSPDDFKTVIELIENHGRDSAYFVNKSFPAKYVVPNADFSEWIVNRIRNNDLASVDRLIYEIRRDAFDLQKEVSIRAAKERIEGNSLTIRSMRDLSNICCSTDEGYSADFMAAIALMTLNGALTPNKYSWGRVYNYLGAVMFPYKATIDADNFLETMRENYNILTEYSNEGSIQKSELSLRLPRELIPIGETLKTLPFSARCKFFEILGCYSYSTDRLGASDIYVDPS